MNWSAINESKHKYVISPQPHVNGVNYVCFGSTISFIEHEMSLIQFELANISLSKFSGY